MTGFPTNQTGVVTVQFLPGAFSDTSGVQDIGSSEQFYLVASTGASPGPTAELANPAPGQPVTAATLNADGYIDVSYRALTATRSTRPRLRAWRRSRSVAPVWRTLR